MTRLYHHSKHKVAQAPGSLQFAGVKKLETPRLTYMDYTVDSLQENADAALQACLALREKPSTSWINLYGLHDPELVIQLSDILDIHPLVREDILHTSQRPKFEDFEKYLYIVCRMVRWDDAKNQIESEQLSLVLGAAGLISFQERPGDVFANVRERLRMGKGRIRGAGPGYLCYALLDAVVDNYFLVLEKFNDQIEDLEEELLDNPEPRHLQLIHELKRELIVTRRAVLPLREVIRGLLASESDLLDEQTEVFLRDVYDHTIQVADTVDSFRDLLSGLQDLYLSSISNRMNEVMKVLTIAATIFVPLTFVAGIYGMNFEFMPELKWKWAYPAFWVFILAAFVSMVVFFRRKKWL
jgi:magnesium transporter